MRRLICSCAAGVLCAMAIGSAPVAAQVTACDSPCKVIPLPLVGRPGAVCDSPCKLMHLPLVERNDRPVPSSNPLRELQKKIEATDTTYFAFQVDKPAVQAPESAWPQYPDSLKSDMRDGEVVAAFIVDTLGVADVSSLHILKSTHPLFTAAVREALPRMRFVPAQLKGVKVRQLVQQPFVFHIVRKPNS